MYTGRIEIPVSCYASNAVLKERQAYAEELRQLHPQSIVEIVFDDESEYIQVCAECGSEDAHEVHYGDEGVTHCPDCQTIEGGYSYVK